MEKSITSAFRQNEFMMINGFTAKYERNWKWPAFLKWNMAYAQFSSLFSSPIVKWFWFWVNENVQIMSCNWSKL